MAYKLRSGAYYQAQTTAQVRLFRKCWSRYRANVRAGILDAPVSDACVLWALDNMIRYELGQACA